MPELNGACLCGAVTVRTTAAKTPELRACHCDMCRRHTSGAFFSIKSDPEAIEVTGPAQTYHSSEWAERGFCSTCGSTLWYATRGDGVRNLAAGLFPDAGGGRLTVEFFSDRCPQGYAIAGTHKKLTTNETLSLFGASEGDAE